MQKKHCDFYTKKLKEDGIFFGYASVFDILDSQGDIIKSGAFDTKNTDIIVLWQHKQDEPIGKVIDFAQDSRGLYINAKLVTQTKRGYEAYRLLQSGVVKGLSIGYVPKIYKIDHNSGARVISSLDLIEISLVTFPANENAKISHVKNNNPYLHAIRDLITELRQ